MTRSEFMEGLRASHILLEDLDLLHTSRRYAPIDPSDEFARYAVHPGGKYSELFRIGLRNRDYNILLNDFAFLQFSHNENREYISLRYAFYPNPFNAITYQTFAQEYEVDESGPDAYELYMQLLDEQEDNVAVPPIRYELSFRAYKELEHPASHLHIGMHPHNRWPVDKILTPQVFSLFISKLFYPDQWNLKGRVNAGIQNQINLFDNRLCSEKAKCNLLDIKFFSATERRQFYLT